MPVIRSFSEDFGIHAIHVELCLPPKRQVEKNGLF